MPDATVVGVREIGPEHELRLVLRHPHLQRLAEVRESARVGVVSTRGNSDISGGIKNYFTVATVAMLWHRATSRLTARPI